jgi:nitrogen regulatory protein PII
MELVTAVVKLDRLDDVIGAVSRAGAGGMTVCEVRGFGRRFGRPVEGVLWVRTGERDAGAV